MPYSQNTELPSGIRNLPNAAQTIWRKAFNAALTKYGDETTARKVAWAAVKNKYRKGTDGTWVLKEANMVVSHRNTKKKQESKAAIETLGEDFVEYAVQDNKVQIDEDNRRLLGVALLGNVSLDVHRRIVRRYEDAAMDEFAAIAEGAKIFLNHPSDAELRDNFGHRDIRNVVGTVRNLRRSGSRVRGDIDVFETAWPLMRDLAKHKIDGLGMSPHLAGPRRLDTSGVQIVEGINQVRSIDVVEEPATTSTFSESQDNGYSIDDGGNDTMDWKEVTLPMLRENVPQLVSEIEKPITEQLTAATTELQKLQGEILEARIKVELTEAKIPEDKRPDYFLASLRAEADQQKRAAMIIEHRKLVTVEKPESSEKGGDKAPAKMYPGYRVAETETKERR